MKRYTILLILFLSVIFISVQVRADCCVIRDSNCTYWEMSSWNQSHEFCDKLGIILGINTTYHTQLCSSLSPNITSCTNGFTLALRGNGICEFPETCSSAPEDCGACPAAPSLTGGGGGCFSEWNCTEWSACANATQQRTCANLKSYCSLGSKPIEEQACAAQLTNQSNATITETLPAPQITPEATPNVPQGIAGITGAVIGAIKKPAGIAITAIIVLIIIIAIGSLIRLKSSRISKEAGTEKIKQEEKPKTEKEK